MITIENFFIDPPERPTANKPKRRSPRFIEEEKEIVERTIADEFHDQVELFYSIPRKVYPRTEIKFSPSMVNKCSRELFYQNTNAPSDVAPKVVPWKARVPRNGEGVHQVTQTDYLKMDQVLADAGLPCRFKMLEVEKTGRKEFDVNGIKVVLSGRCDGVLIDLDDGTKIIYEKKTKDKMSNMKKIKEPQDDHKAQAICYSLLFDTPRCIFEYEALQKPKWSDDDGEDQRHFFFESNEDLEEELLYRLAEIVQSIEAGTPPDREYGKCGFCPYKEKCGKDE